MARSGRRANSNEVWEDGMHYLVMLGQAAIGLGVLLMGLAALWFVYVYQQKKP